MDNQNIVITRQGSITAVRGSETTFTGDVTVTFLMPRRDNSRLSGGLVTFSPHARTHWHTHPYGQTLIIIAGKGLIQQWGKPVEEVSAGDIVWFPAGIKHWHGATPDTTMSHYAVQEELDGQAVQWMESVTEQQYSTEI